MTFSAIVSADTLAQFVDNATALVTEAKLNLTEDGLELSATDPANVGMIDQSLDAEAFESYEFDGGVIGVDLDRLADVLGMADSGQLAYLELDEGTNALRIEIGGLDYKQGLIDPDAIRSEPDVPDVLDELTAHLVIEARELMAAETAADLCGDRITIGADADADVFYAEASGDTDTMRIEWPTNEDVALANSRIDADANSLLSLDYLADMLGPIRSGAEVTVHIGDSFPVFFDSAFADGEGSLRYTLAPRVATDGGRSA